MDYSVLVDKVSENREAFIEAHKGRIGSTRAAAICGQNDYCTPFDVWCEMTGRAPAFEGNNATWFGQRFEPIIAEKFTQETGFSTVKINQVWQSTKYPWLICSPDYRVYESEDDNSGLLEAKSQGHWAKDNWAENQAPNYAHTQLIAQMIVASEIQFGYCCGLIGGFDFFKARYDRSPNAEPVIIETCQRFMEEYFLQDKPPPTVAQDKEKVAKYLGEAIKDFEVELDEDCGKLIASFDKLNQAYRDAAQSSKLLKEEIDAIKTQLMLKMGTAAIGRYGERFVKRSLIKNKGSVTEPYEYTRIDIK